MKKKKHFYIAHSLEYDYVFVSHNE